MNLEQNHLVSCPYCGEEVGIVVDCTIGSQAFIEDCSVCCRPIQFSVQLDDDGNVANLQAQSDDE